MTTKASGTNGQSKKVPGQIIALCNQKGGSTKTSTAENLAAALIRAGKRVLVVDLDPQFNLTGGLNVKLEPGQPGVNDLLNETVDFEDVLVDAPGWEGVQVLPGQRATANIESNGDMDIMWRLRNALDEAGARERWDYVIVDTNPFVGKILANALAAADTVIIPTDAQIDGLSGVEQILESVKRAQKNFNDRLRVLAIVIGRREAGGEQDFRDEELRAAYGELVARQTIPKRAALTDAHGAHQPIHTIKGPGAMAIRIAFDDLAAELNLV